MKKTAVEGSSAISTTYVLPLRSPWNRKNKGSYIYIPLLDTLLHHKNDGSLDVSIYRKPTHTDRYLHFSFHHPRHMKVWSFASFTEHALSLKARMLKQKKNTSDPDNLLIGIHPSWAVDSSQRSISTGEEVQRRIPSLCSCGHVYIGETKKALETRIKEHKAATRRGKIEKSPIAEASQNLLSALLIHD